MSAGRDSQDAAGVGLFSAIADTLRFYRCIVYFVLGGNYTRCPHFASRLQVRMKLKPCLCVFFELCSVVKVKVA